MRFKKIGAALLACAMCFGVFSTTAFAYVDESVATEEPAVEEKVPETEPEEPMLPLTPDGNLTLVDDAGSPTKSGKQFITAVTKNGNYFYIIIDRDDKGEETVHFLNQVDEADLLKLMDEEEVAEFTKPVEETKPEVVETVPEITEPTPEEKPKSTNMLPAILTLIVLACGGGFFVFKKVQEKKKAQEAAKLTQMLIMWTMTRTMGTIRSLRTTMKIAPSMKMIMNLCKQDRLDAWGSLRVAFT